MIRHFRTLSAVLLVLMLVWAPLPFASVTRLGAMILTTATFLLAGLVLAGVRRWRELGPAVLPAAAMVALALLGIVQSLPWPSWLLGFLSPEHLLLYEAASGEGAAGHLSLAPEASRRAALLWLAPAALILTTPAVGVHRLHRRMLALSLLVGGLFQIFYGAPRWFTASGMIWGVPVQGSGARLRGTFVNPDHLAMYLTLVAAVVFAWGWWAVQRARRTHRIEERLLWLVPPALLWLMIVAGLAFTGSRGGALAAVFGLAIQGGLVAGLGRGEGGERRARTGRGLAVAGGVVLAALAMVVTARDAFARLLGTSPYELAWNTRTYAYGPTLELWRDFPWLGTGLGTFRDGFAMVQTERLPGTWTHAHNAPLELAATVGVVGLVIVAVGIFLLLWGLLRVWLRAVHREGQAAALAALGATAAGLAHECLDFGLTTPANGFTLAILCGATLGVPLRRSSRRRSQQQSRPEESAPGPD